MSTSSLPEELVEQILNLCGLAPPEWTVRDYFADDGLTLRARIRGRSHGLLLVSRAWYRIGAPLLYAALALAQPAHARGAAAALRRTPALGHAVRALWLEPDFPRELLDVAQRTPHIERLFVGLQLDVRDHVNGLRAALPLLNPRTVVLAGLGRKWQNALRVEAVLADCVRARWANLTRLWLNASSMSPALLDALRRAPALQEFAAPVSSAWNWLYTRTGHPGVLVDLAKNPALETVYVVARDSWNLKHWEFEVGEAQRAVARDARPASKSSEPTNLEKILELVECVVLT